MHSSCNVNGVSFMKAFISVDLEGMPYVVIPGQLNLKGSLYDEARRTATKIALIAADELNKNGSDEVLIADSHGPMVNLLVDDLPEYVEIVRGFPRPLSMISGVEDSQIALFLGYHAKFGTAKSTFDHTYSGRSINRVQVNGILASEFLLNAYVAGELGVPVILVAGEAQLLSDDVQKYAPWAETVALKHSMSRLSARSSSLVRIEKELRGSIKKAVAKHKRNGARLLVPKKPVSLEIDFLATHFADAAELLPNVRRIDGLKVEYTADDMVGAYKVFELLGLTSSGVSALYESSR
jgi:D-amino peptidase